MSEEGPKPKSVEVMPRPAPARRQDAAETVTTIAATLGDQKAESGEIARAAAGKALESLAPGQADGTATPETIQRVAGLVANDQQKPGPTLIQRIIKALGR